ncbi:MAG: LuxR C-terminal-related transcriptional regulator, partial [Anaerolineae bacterium]
AGGRHGREIDIVSLLALSLATSGGSAEADETLAEAVSLAEPEGYVRVFLDLGWPLGALLQRSATTAPLPGSYLRDLLEAFRGDQEVGDNRMAVVAPPMAPHVQALADPLTERELEVLQLLAEGLSNKEIGRRLVVAPSTVKQHLKHIYGKLDVHSRTQAVARGRELMLL